jgi:hypothetical protein
MDASALRLMRTWWTLHSGLISHTYLQGYGMSATWRVACIAHIFARVWYECNVARSLYHKRHLLAVCLLQGGLWICFDAFLVLGMDLVSAATLHIAALTPRRMRAG